MLPPTPHAAAHLDLVKENRIVEGEAEADRVGGRELRGLLGGRFVGVVGALRVLFFYSAFGELREVPGSSISRNSISRIAV